MTVRTIKATIECDGCGGQFRVDLDPADSRPPDWTWHDLAEDMVRAGNQAESVKGQPIGITSVQHDMMMCPSCTKTADAIGDDDDYKPSKNEIVAAIANST